MRRDLESKLIGVSFSGRKTDLSYQRKSKSRHTEKIKKDGPEQELPFLLAEVNTREGAVIRIRSHVGIQ